MSNRCKSNSGFTLVELMIVIGIVGILAALAVPIYRDYTTRSKISEGLSVVAKAKISVAEYVYSTGVFPSTNADVGIPSAHNTAYVSTITISGAGLVTVVYTAATGVSVGSDAIQFVPTLNAEGHVTWSCNGAGTTIADRFLPPICR